jgi:hypothetical protein
MRRAQRSNQAEDAASKLSSLLRSTQVAQLLQHPLPAQPTVLQKAVLSSCSNSLLQLHTALPETPNNSSSRSALLQQLSGVLRHQAVHSTGLLLAWMQQQPQQLVAALRYSEDEHAAIMQRLWPTGVQVVFIITLLIRSCSASNSSSTAPLAFTLTQQLHQSGECIWSGQASDAWIRSSRLLCTHCALFQPQAALLGWSNLCSSQSHH